MTTRIACTVRSTRLRRKSPANRHQPPLHSIDMPGTSSVGDSFTPRWPLDEEFATHTIVFLALGDGEDVRHFLIESAIVRWSEGRHAGWEILSVGAVSQASFAEIIGRCDSALALC